MAGNPILATEITTDPLGRWGCRHSYPAPIS